MSLEAVEAVFDSTLSKGVPLGIVGHSNYCAESRDNDSTIEAVQSYEMDDPWFSWKHDAGCGVEEFRVTKHLKQENSMPSSHREIWANYKCITIKPELRSRHDLMFDGTATNAVKFAFLLNHTIKLFMPNEDKLGDILKFLE